MRASSKNNLFVVSIFILVFCFLAFAFYNIFIKSDYKVTKQIPCDPNTESCFVSDCAGDDPNCDQTTTYKKIYVQSKFAGSDYENLSCTQGSSFCQIVTCQDNTTEPGEKCFK